MTRATARLERAEAELVAYLARNAAAALPKEAMQYAQAQAGWREMAEENIEGMGAAEEHWREVRPTRFAVSARTTLYAGSRPAKEAGGTEDADTHAEAGKNRLHPSLELDYAARAREHGLPPEERTAANHKGEVDACVAWEREGVMWNYSAASYGQQLRDKEAENQQIHDKEAEDRRLRTEHNRLAALARRAKRIEERRLAAVARRAARMAEAVAAQRAAARQAAAIAEHGVGAEDAEEWSWREEDELVEAEMADDDGMQVEEGERAESGTVRMNEGRGENVAEHEHGTGAAPATEGYIGHLPARRLGAEVRAAEAAAVAERAASAAREAEEGAHEEEQHQYEALRAAAREEQERAESVVAEEREASRREAARESPWDMTAVQSEGSEQEGRDTTTAGVQYWEDMPQTTRELIARSKALLIGVRHRCMEQATPGMTTEDGVPVGMEPKERESIQVEATKDVVRMARALEFEGDVERPWDSVWAIDASVQEEEAQREDEWAEAAASWGGWNGEKAIGGALPPHCGIFVCEQVATYKVLVNEKDGARVLLFGDCSGALAAEEEFWRDGELGVESRADAKIGGLISELITRERLRIESTGGRVAKGWVRAHGGGIGPNAYADAIAKSHLGEPPEDIELWRLPRACVYAAAPPPRAGRAPPRVSCLYAARPLRRLLIEGLTRHRLEEWRAEEVDGRVRRAGLLEDEKVLGLVAHDRRSRWTPSTPAGSELQQPASQTGRSQQLRGDNVGMPGDRSGGAGQGEQLLYGAMDNTDEEDDEWEADDEERGGGGGGRPNELHNVRSTMGMWDPRVGMQGDRAHCRTGAGGDSPSAHSGGAGGARADVGSANGHRAGMETAHGRVFGRRARVAHGRGAGREPYREADVLVRVGEFRMVRPKGPGGGGAHRIRGRQRAR